uniref:Cryptochrome DASH n=1 Tax=Alexandrium monilatum TaxID=311494 RepID=A0A7S4QMC6_9DINO
MERTIVWFRADLRLHDNPLLHHSAAQPRWGRDVFYVYCADPQLFSGRLRVTGLPKVGPRRAAFMRQCVQDLRRSLRSRGSELLVFCAAAAAVLPRLTAARSGGGQVGDASAAGGEQGLQAVRVLATAGVTPEEQQEERAVEEALGRLRREAGGPAASLERVWGLTLYHVEDLPYRDVRRELPMVFAPFGRAVRGNFKAADATAVAAARRGEAGVPIREELPRPVLAKAPPAALTVDSLEDLASAWPEAAPYPVELPTEPADSKAERWWDEILVGGETAGLQRLAEFLARDVRSYKETRNRLVGLRYSSKLSAWTAAGCVSPRRAAHALREWEAKNTRSGEPTPSTAHILSEFGWRDYLILLSWKCGPRLFQLRGPGRVQQSWRRDAELEAKLFQGRTGLPLVDAAIREMAVSGFMSNRARQFVASYVIVDLKLDWRVGAELFESLLVDYDVHANWGNWMRAAGVDGQGFGHSGSRWFNLAEERDRFDPRGDFVKLWVSELASVPARYIHIPWTMPLEEQRRAGCMIGKDYPAPPDSPSKQALDGSADPALQNPELFATTREGKTQGARGGKGRGGGRGSRGRGSAAGGPPEVRWPGGDERDQGPPGGTWRPKRRWGNSNQQGAL